MSSGRRFRNFRIEEAIRGFERFGYQLQQVRGSHYILKHPDKGLLVLPFHRGTVKAVIIFDALKNAGISAEEFGGAIEDMEYSAVVHKVEEGGYWVKVPALQAAILRVKLSKKPLRT